MYLVYYLILFTMDIYFISSREISITSNNGSKNIFLFNPDTGYILMPSNKYSEYDGSDLKEIKEKEKVKGIYNHTKINSFL